jgi:hypothetical protein
MKAAMICCGWKAVFLFPFAIYVQMEASRALGQETHPSQAPCNPFRAIGRSELGDSAPGIDYILLWVPEPKTRGRELVISQLVLTQLTSFCCVCWLFSRSKAVAIFSGDVAS